MTNPSSCPRATRQWSVELGDDISPETNGRVYGLMAAIEGAETAGVLEMVPTYRSLLVYYDPDAVTATGLEEAIRELGADALERESREPRVVEVPTRYGGEHGPDLDFVARHAGLSVDEVVSLHSGVDYLVYMMGFSPGFPYLGGLHPALATPRLESPRSVIPAGSVGIAEGQTGVYPVASPGGWRLIGRTPVKLFDPQRRQPTLLSPGDRVRFVPVDDAELEAAQSPLPSLGEG